jgi:hypothetical protein
MVYIRNGEHSALILNNRDRSVCYVNNGFHIVISFNDFLGSSVNLNCTNAALIGYLNVFISSALCE